MLVEDLVVAEPEFEGEVGADGDEAVELYCVADGPGQAQQESDGEDESGALKRLRVLRAPAIEEPGEEKWEQDAQSRIRQESETPKGAIGDGHCARGIAFEFQGEPEKCGREQRGK